MSVKISVVIPTYRRPDLLKRCLRALAEQSFPKSDFEVIVVSDGPDAKVSEVVMQFAGTGLQLQGLHLHEQAGPAAARNMGWQLAKGALIVFTDDDTVPEPEWLSAYWQHYRGEILIAYTGKIVVPHPARPTDYEFRMAKLEKADFVTANCCCTRAALVSVDGFDERYSATWRADNDLEFRLLLQRIPIKDVSGAVVVHPVREAPWGISIWEQRKAVFNALLYRKFPAYYRKYIQPRPALHYYAIVLSALTAFTAFWIRNDQLLMYTGVAWLLLTLWLIGSRLWRTSLAPGHVLEMVITSLAIPFASVYWHLRGAWRYRVVFF